MMQFRHVTPTQWSAAVALFEQLKFARDQQAGGGFGRVQINETLFMSLVEELWVHQHDGLWMDEWERETLALAKRHGTKVDDAHTPGYTAGQEDQ